MSIGRPVDYLLRASCDHRVELNVRRFVRKFDHSLSLSLIYTFAFDILREALSRRAYYMYVIHRIVTDVAFLRVKIARG